MNTLKVKRLVPGAVLPAYAHPGDAGLDLFSAVETFLDWFQRFRHYMRWVQRVSGVLLIAVGLLLVTGEFTRLAGWLQSLTPGFLRKWL